LWRRPRPKRAVEPRKEEEEEEILIGTVQSVYFLF
jgi:hypothetical protein